MLTLALEIIARQQDFQYGFAPCPSLENNTIRCQVYPKELRSVRDECEKDCQSVRLSLQGSGVRAYKMEIGDVIC